MNEIFGYMVLTLIFGSITLGTLWITYQSHRIQQFKKNMKVGDSCIIYIGEVRYYATIVEILDDYVVVKTIYSTKPFKVRKSEIYI
ncbi:MAG: hypothetical protein M0P47_09475 [Bacteroidales bacterium]|nr:hypothetical protein [Bacteroidales bacterium]